MRFRKKFKLALTNQNGMSVTELMVCICILGILAAAAIPSYITYVQQARVISLILPRLHLIETSIGLFFSQTQKLPHTSDLSTILEEIDTDNLSIDLQSGTISLTIVAPDSSSKLHILDGNMLIASPVIANSNTITNWHLAGELADRLEINY